MNVVCPCCGSATNTPPSPEHLLTSPVFSEIEKDVLDKLVTSYPQYVNREQIAEFVYAFRDEPESDALKVHIHRLKNKLQQFGWSLANEKHFKSGRGNRAKYVLQQLPEKE